MNARKRYRTAHHAQKCHTNATTFLSTVFAPSIDCPAHANEIHPNSDKAKLAIGRARYRIARMHLYLGPDISQAFWRLVYPDGRAPSASAHTPVAHDRCACSSTDIFSLAPQWVAHCQENGCEIVDAIVFDKSSTRTSTHSKTTVWSGPILPGSFCPYRQNVSVSSPSFTFLQLASRLSLPELIAYGNELCGHYAFAASEPRGMRQRETLFNWNTRSGHPA